MSKNLNNILNVSFDNTPSVNRINVEIIDEDETLDIAFNKADKTFSIHAYKGAETIYQLLHIQEQFAAYLIFRGLLKERTGIDWSEQDFPNAAEWLKLCNHIK